MKQQLINFMNEETDVFPLVPLRATRWEIYGGLVFLLVGVKGGAVLMRLFKRFFVAQ